MTDQPTPSRRAGLRDEIARAIHRYDHDHMLSSNDIPSGHHRGEADAVLTLLYREWPWLRAEAEDAAIERVRHLVTAAADTTAAGISDYDIGRHDLAVAVLAALDEPVAAATEPVVDRQTAVVLAALHHSAEADVSRIIALYERWVKAGPPPLGTPTARWWDIRLAELHAAILPPEPADPTAAEQQLAAIVEVARTKGVISIDGIRAITDPPKERRAVTDDYEQTTGHTITCTAAFTGVCDCPADTDPGDLAGYAMPDPPINCLSITTAAPAAVVEVRDPCPYCEDCRLIPRHAKADHLRDIHPEAGR